MLWAFVAALACIQPVAIEVSYETDKVTFEDPPYQEVISLLKEPARKGHWEHPPAVYVCRQTPITKGRVSKAMGLWGRLGYEMEGPFMRSEIPVCLGEDDFSWGNIVIKLRGQDFPEDKLAITRAYRRVEDDVIVGVIIEIQSFASEKERTLEHEFGHALGWKHFNRKYHLMNSIHTFGGWDTHGLRRPR
jgi:hypothetical protein